MALLASASTKRAKRAVRKSNKRTKMSSQAVFIHFKEIVISNLGSR